MDQLVAIPVRCAFNPVCQTGAKTRELVTRRAAVKGLAIIRCVKYRGCARLDIAHAHRWPEFLRVAPESLLVICPGCCADEPCREARYEHERVVDWGSTLGQVAACVLLEAMGSQQPPLLCGRCGRPIVTGGRQKARKEEICTDFRVVFGEQLGEVSIERYVHLDHPHKIVQLAHIFPVKHVRQADMPGPGPIRGAGIVWLILRLHFPPREAREPSWKDSGVAAVAAILVVEDDSRVNVGCLPQRQRKVTERVEGQARRWQQVDAAREHEDSTPRKACESGPGWCGVVDRGLECKRRHCTKASDTILAGFKSVASFVVRPFTYENIQGNLPGSESKENAHQHSVL
eukprot:2182439-Prymnesium_polylepis.1